MTAFRRFALALGFASLLPLAAAQAQRPSISTVNITPEEGRVHVSAVGGAFDLKVEVVNETGDTVFEAAQVSDKGLAWEMTDSLGKRVSPGTYTITASYATPSGKLRKRIEQVMVTEEVAGAGDAKEAAPEKASASAPNPQPLVDGGGAANRITKFTDADTLTSSSMIDLSGRIGVGTLAPRAGWRMEVVGSTLFRPGGTGGEMQFSTPNGETGLSWLKGTASRADIRFNGTALTLAAAAGNPAPVPPATNGLVVTTAGRVGIGTGGPAVAGLHIGSGVSGGQAQLRLDNSNGTSGGLNRWTNRLEVVSSNAIALSAGGIARPGLWLEPNGSVGIKVFPQSTLHVAGDVTFDYGGNSRLYLGTGGANVDLNRSLEVRNTYSYPLFSGLKVGGITVSHDDAYTIVPERGNLLVRGRAAIGARNTLSGVGLYVVGSSAGVQAETSSGYGVIGTGPSGVYGRNTSGTGYAGYFDGRVHVQGAFTFSSDRALKSNFSAVNPRHILDRLSTLPIRTWSYKAEGAGVRHLGPVAQEFRAAFVLGSDDESIGAVDVNGVALASIQALYQMMQEKDRQIERLQAELNQVRRVVRRGRPGKR